MAHAYGTRAVSPYARTVLALAAAGATDPGRQRDVNEDRFHVDEARGLLIVIDGVGGQAAGGKAADIALSMIRERLERETGTIADRVREAIAIANNEIYRVAASRPEWEGMACVLTVAVVKDGRATIGHVGDTRLYKLRGCEIHKVTRDHSPVGEREDAFELSEAEAMRHPRRNEVYRDVGSAPHSPGDPEFVDIHEIPFETDEALLLCSDGLTDLVDSASILGIVADQAGTPRGVVQSLVAEANAAGGKDNVTVVYAAGENFRPRRNVSVPRQAAFIAPVVPSGRPARSRRLPMFAAMLALTTVTGLVVYRTALMPWTPAQPATAVSPREDSSLVVRSGESIAAAIERAEPRSVVLVEPGEYQEHVALSRGIRLVSQVPRRATIRLPATASDAEPEPAVVATGSEGSELVGFRIVGDARTPLGVGVRVAGTGVSLVDVEVSGAADAAIAFEGESGATMVGSDIHDNPGVALQIRAGAAPRITHSVFSRNGLSPRAPGSFTIERGASAAFHKNVFVGVRPDVFASADDETRRRLTAENWFVPQPARSSQRPAQLPARRP
jgi:serine/threonine protein phosphatase PrpC